MAFSNLFVNLMSRSEKWNRLSWSHVAIVKVTTARINSVLKLEITYCTLEYVSQIYDSFFQIRIKFLIQYWQTNQDA